MIRLAIPPQRRKNTLNPPKEIESEGPAREATAGQIHGFSGSLMDGPPPDHDLHSSLRGRWGVLIWQAHPFLRLESKVAVIAS
jgi:hypothetical protein